MIDRTDLMRSVAVAACLAAAPACAQEARTYDIPQGPMRAALDRFAVQADVQMLYAGEAVAGISSPGLRGRYSVGQGLDQLLAGSGLTWSETRPGVIIVRPLEQRAEVEAAPAELEEVVVTGTLLRGSGELASPVIVLDRGDLDRRGLGTVADTLAALPQNYGGAATPTSVLAGADRAGSNSAFATGINLRGLGPDSTLVLVNGRRMAGTGFRAEFADISALPSAAVERVDVLLDGASALYTAFAALDPLTQDKVSRLAGTVSETRHSSSGPAGLSAGRASVSRSEIDRPLLEPGEVRALPDDVQIVFAAGRRPLRARKLRYDRREPFRTRASIPPPSADAPIDTPGPRPHPWAGRRALGDDPAASLPLFKEVAAARDERRAAAEREAGLYRDLRAGLAAEAAVLDHFQGGERHD